MYGTAPSFAPPGESASSGMTTSASCPSIVRSATVKNLSFGTISLLSSVQAGRGRSAARGAAPRTRRTTRLPIGLGIGAGVYARRGRPLDRWGLDRRTLGIGPPPTQIVAQL